MKLTVILNAEEVRRACIDYAESHFNVLTCRHTDATIIVPGVSPCLLYQSLEVEVRTLDRDGEDKDDGS